MKKLYASADRLLVYHLQNALASEGINCVINNDMIYSLAGEVPVNEVWPELWLSDESQLKKARKILSELLIPLKCRPGLWHCRQCGEQHESQFTECWQCGLENNG
ncbi:MAG: DUF2007 domain-containing protein [Gammaproteobacteria bacterium]|nr:DUF2007 domain-containing protein [Gammaproteobacteria bacterium]